jgi:hypothetical protein
MIISLFLFYGGGRTHDLLARRIVYVTSSHPNLLSGCFYLLLFLWPP